MLLREQIVSDLKNAMKSGDAAKRDTLRVIDSMIKNEEIAQKKRETGLDDVETIVLIKRAIKQRKDSAMQYRSGGREDLAEKEEQEIAMIEGYLPQQLSEEELREVVARIIEKTGAQSRADMGKVMGSVMQEVGDKTDGNAVRVLVEELLV
jgi:uncharacterized protein